MKNSNSWCSVLYNDQAVSTISVDLFETWKQHLIFDHCRDKTMGESFCDYFSVKDFLLLYNIIPADSIDSYIRDQYLEKPMAH